MLQIDARNLGPGCAGVSRRDFVRVGALGMLGLTLADWFKLKAHGAAHRGEGQVRHPALDVGRPVSPGYVRPEAGSGGGLLRLISRIPSRPRRRG